MDTVRAAGAEPIITANYGSGTPEEAAGWVRHANVTNDHGVRYFEIGNEVYGNGHYGAQWETDHHPSKSPTTYASYVVEYAAAMKAVDPTIQIGAVLTTPGSWPDGIVGPGDTMDWNNTVMSIAGSMIDFVIVHHYPCATSQEDLPDAPQTEIPGMAAALRSLIDRYAGDNAGNVGIAVTEAAATAYKNTSPSGLFTPDEYLTWLEQGAFTLDWWNLHNGTDCGNITEVEGATDYDDGGILSSGAACEPPLNTPFPPYHGTRMIGELGSPGDTLVRTGSSTPLVSAHAVRTADGAVNVMLINKDPDNAATVDLSYQGFTPSPATPTVYSYLKNATAIDSAGPWSDPIRLPGVKGIDPDLAWDEDGNCWCTTAGIEQIRIDPRTGRAFGPPRRLWSGTAGAKAPEAPHLYRIGDYWYLLIAEGVPNGATVSPSPAAAHPPAPSSHARPTRSSPTAAPTTPSRTPATRTWCRGPIVPGGCCCWGCGHAGAPPAGTSWDARPSWRR